MVNDLRWDLLIWAVYKTIQYGKHRRNDNTMAVEHNLRLKFRLSYGSPLRNSSIYMHARTSKFGLYNWIKQTYGTCHSNSPDQSRTRSIKITLPSLLPRVATRYYVCRPPNIHMKVSASPLTAPLLLKSRSLALSLIGYLAPVRRSVP